MKSKAEFDTYAEGYEGGAFNPLARLIGKNQTTFIDVKAKWITEHLEKSPDLKLLDFGCGTGELINCLKKNDFKGQIEGCDVSRQMLIKASERLSENDSKRFKLLEGDRLPYNDNEFDVLTAVCVFHHIDKEQHALRISEIKRVLKPNGRIFVFEHNPFNPITRIMVAQAPMDKNAVLVSPQRMKKTITASNFIDVSIEYMLFLPPRFSWTTNVDRVLKHVPLGGQYVVSAKKQ